MTRLLMFPLLVLASAPVHAADTVRLLVSGDPSSNCNLFISELLRNVPAGADVSIDSIGLGIVRDGSRYVFAPDNLANPSAAVAALDGKVPPTLLAENVTIIDSDRGYLVQWPAKEPLDFVSRLIEKRRADPLAREEWPGTWKAGQGSLSHYGEGANEMLVLDVQGAPPMQGRETVPGGLITAKFEGRTTRIYGICKVRGESARRFAALKTARAESDLALGLGNFVAGKHNSEEMRRLVLDSLLAMKFDALIPSSTVEVPHSQQTRRPTRER